MEYNAGKDNLSMASLFGSMHSGEHASRYISSRDNQHCAHASSHGMASNFDNFKKIMNFICT